MAMVSVKESDPKSFVEHVLESGIDVASSVVEKALLSNAFRGPLLRKIEKYVLASVKSGFDQRWPARAHQDQVDMIRAMFASAERALARRQVSRKALHRLVKALLMNTALRRDEQAVEAVRRFKERHGSRSAPRFLVIGPNKTCNLHCIGCYASSERSDERLEWDVFDRIITEAKQMWGIRFFTITGGEPLMYRSQGKDLLDMVEKHNDCFFQMYTNGTLITPRMAERMADVGSLVPAISVEGLEERTDKRRGKGVFRRILSAMENLRRAGVPFGISLTPTRENAEEIFSDEFIEFFFEEQQAVFGWLFQYMPIGRGYTLDLVVTPEQRLWMWERTWQIVRERKIMFADFWNCGTVSCGCMAGGDAYLYIDWNGKVMPCVFVPYSPANIYDVYNSGGTLDDLYDLPYFKAIRRWQWDYAIGKEGDGRRGNWLLPCLLRDHYAVGRALIDKYRPEPEDEPAAEALRDESYRARMLEYDENLRKLFDPVWEEEYLRARADRA